jgi:hypothetical protein
MPHLPNVTRLFQRVHSNYGSHRLKYWWLLMHVYKLSHSNNSQCKYFRLYCIPTLSDCLNLLPTIGRQRYLQSSLIGQCWVRKVNYYMVHFNLNNLAFIILCVCVCVCVLLCCLFLHNIKTNTAPTFILWVSLEQILFEWYSCLESALLLLIDPILCSIVIAFVLAFMSHNTTYCI